MLETIIYSIRISLVSSVTATVLGVAICALLVMRKKSSSRIVRAIQIPIIVPHVVVALLILIMCSQNGLIARLCYALGIISEQSQFPTMIYDNAGIGVIFAYVWKETPFIVYFVIALMSNINEKLGEAAINLGASRFKAFMKVTLPLCRNAILSGFLIIFAFSLGAYELPFILGATKPKALPVQAYIEYIHPDLRNRPYAMALNGVIILISVISAIIYFVLISRKFRAAKVRRSEYEE